MSTALFRLFQNINSHDAITDYLDNSSFDELIEFDINNDHFVKQYHTENKYTSLMNEGSYKELFVSLYELSVHPDDRERFCDMMDPVTLNLKLQSSKIKGLVSDEFRFRLLDESWCWVELVLISGDFRGVPEGAFRIYIYDINSFKMRELGVNRSFRNSDYNRNEITGLVGKKGFIREAQKIINADDKNWCIIAVDINNFKLYNEWFGRSSGDLLMAQLGAKCRSAAGMFGGTAGYFGQDDFCLLMSFDKAVIENLYDDIVSLVPSNGSDTAFRPAFGICLADSDSSVDDITDRAFLALQAAKKSYQKHIRLFDPSIYSKEDAEYHILTDFMRALKKGEITFFLQPQCRASTGKIVGAEALCRWIMPDGSMVSPVKFIPILEKRGLITDLDLYIWEEVCKWQRKWIDKGHVPLPVSVNTSAADIMNINVPEVFTELLSKYRLSHDLIKIEITESAYSSNATHVKNTVHSLRDKGFTVMMDDFGSGYSTLNMLSNLSVDIIKLDAQFLVMDKDNSQKSIQILESVATMSKTIGIPVIVEGVETEKQKIFLQDMGCSYIQGYYFYHPMDVSSYEELISDQNNIDTGGIKFKPNQQFQLREILDGNIYSDTMLNNILGPCALYSWHGDKVDIIRFNQQFYRAVDVPDFIDRLDDIKRFLPPLDIDRMDNLLSQAKEDHLNGSSGLLHFYKTDGTLTTFHMHFYYLRREEDGDIFYGAVKNITHLSTLEKQFDLLSRYLTETIIFLSFKPDESAVFTVLFNAFEKDTGLKREQLENELNSRDFFKRIDSEDPQSVYRHLLDHFHNLESFEFKLNMKTSSGEVIKIVAIGDYVIDDTNTVDYIITVRKA